MDGIGHVSIGIQIALHKLGSAGCRGGKSDYEQEAVPEYDGHQVCLWEVTLKSLGSAWQTRPTKPGHR